MANMQLAVRGSQGLYMVQGPPEYKEEKSFPAEKSSKCKVSTLKKRPAGFIQDLSLSPAY